MFSIRRYYRNALAKPNEFSRIGEIFVPILLNLTLWLAVASFAISILTGFKATHIITGFAIMEMTISEATAYFIHLIIIIVFGGVFVFAMGVVVYLIISWIVLNITRLIRHRGRMGKEKESEVELGNMKLDTKWAYIIYSVVGLYLIKKIADKLK